MWPTTRSGILGCAPLHGGGTRRLFPTSTCRVHGTAPPAGATIGAERGDEAQIALGTNLRRARGETAGLGAAVAAGADPLGEGESSAAEDVSVAPRASGVAIGGEATGPADSAVGAACAVARETADAVDTSVALDPGGPPPFDHRT